MAFHALSTAALLSMAIAQTPPRTDAPDRAIRVSGEGVATAAPDMATITIGVVAQKPYASEAIEENGAAMKRVVETIRGSNVAAKDIQTTGFHVHPIHERDNDGRTLPGIRGYEARNDVRVHVRDLARLGAVLDAAVKAGSNRVSGITFDVSDPRAVTDEARKKAMADARHRAEALAKEAGVKLGQVISIRELAHGPPQPFHRAEMFAADAGGVPIERGENELRVTVEVAYEIAGAAPAVIRTGSAPAE